MFSSMNSFSTIINKIWWWACHKSCTVNLQDVDFVISFPFSSIFVTSSSNGTEKIIHFSVFSYKQLEIVQVQIQNSNCSANPFMIKL